MRLAIRLGMVWALSIALLPARLFGGGGQEEPAAPPEAPPTPAEQPSPPSTSLPVPEPFQPQNVRQLKLSDDIDAILTRGGEQHHYEIIIPESGYLDAETIGRVDTFGSLLDVDGRPIISDDDSGEGRNFRLLAALPPGKHYLLVEGFSENRFGEYRLQVAFEPDVSNNSSTPFPLDFNSPRADRINGPGDVDYYRITTAQSGMLILQAQHSLAIVATLITPQGNRQLTETAFPIRVPVVLGEYLLEVTANFFESANDYTVEAQFVPTQRLPINSKLQDQIDPMSLQKIYSITVPSHGTLTFEGQGNIQSTLLNARGMALNRHDSLNDGIVHIQRFVEPGNYLLWVVGDERAVEDGYNLQAIFLPEYGDTAISAGIIEPDIRLLSDIILPNDVDLFRFTLPTAEVISVETLSDAPLVVALQDEGQANISTTRSQIVDCPAESLQEWCTHQFHPLSPGEYYIRIDGEATTNYPIRYKVWTTHYDITPISIGVSLTSTIETAGETHYYQIVDAPASSSPLVVQISSDIEIESEILNRDGQPINISFEDTAPVYVRVHARKERALGEYRILLTNEQ